TLAVLSITAAFAQSKLKLGREDYEKWHTLSGVGISPDGRWSSYKLDYEKASDTMFIQQIKSSNKRSFPNATQIAFSPDSKSAVISYQDDAIAIYNLVAKTSVV